MTLAVHYFLPETKGVPIEEMSIAWNVHWFWKRYAERDDAVDRPDGIHFQI